ncbi:MAG TPA: hypothetical protein VMM18_16180 [Gemmatimonadaceae bacterium]|nr:hypothetical protein [Gemmatimonadaceae bacterium]
MPASSVSVEFLARSSPPSPDASLERELGRSKMSVVFLARDVALDRPVAIKLLPEVMASSPPLRERFLRQLAQDGGLAFWKLEAR